MKIKSVIDFINLIKSDGQSRYFKNRDIVRAFNNASIDLWNQLHPSYQAQQSITDLLKPFKRTTPSPIPIINGSAEVPEEYAYGTSFWIQNDDTDTVVDMLRDSEFRSRKSSKLLAPEKEFPIGKINNIKIDLAPLDLDGGLMIEYLKKPNDVVLVSTISSDGRAEIIDEINSIDTEWDERILPDLIKKVATTLGITLNDNWLTQYQSAKQ